MFLFSLSLSYENIVCRVCRFSQTGPRLCGLTARVRLGDPAGRALTRVGRRSAHSTLISELCILLSPYPVPSPRFSLSGVRQVLLSLVEIAGHLQIHPELWSCLEHLREQNGGFSGHVALAVDQGVHAL